MQLEQPYHSVHIDKCNSSAKIFDRDGESLTIFSQPTGKRLLVGPVAVVGGGLIDTVSLDWLHFTLSYSKLPSLLNA